MRCSLCELKIPSGKLKCPGCGAWCTESVSEENLHPLSEIASSAGDRLETGPWDLAWGGGIVTDSVTLYAGAPGAGKSTLVLQIARAVAGLSKTVLYVSKEESLGRVKGRADRIEIPLDLQRRIVLVNQVRDLRALLDRVEPRLLIIDSLSAYVGFSADPRDGLQVLEDARSYAQDARCPAIVISHVNKQGEFFGAVAFEHLIDVTIFLKVDKKNKAHRILEPQKSRDGAVDVSVHFLMTPKGLQVIENPDESRNFHKSDEGTEDFPEKSV